MLGHSRLTRVALSVLQPPLPDWQHSLPPSGPIAWAIRLVLVWYTLLVTTPLVTVLLLCTRVLPVHPEWKALPAAHRYVRCFTIYFLSNLIWAITSYGSPPAVDRCKIPPISEWLFSRDWTRSWAKGQLDAYIQTIPPLADEARFGILSHGAVQPSLPAGTTPGFWLSQVSPDPKHDAKVFLYLVGGGYVIGTPLLGAFAYSLVHRTSYAVFAPDYAKALSLETSFPGPLGEALAAYQSLRSRGWDPKQIVLVGDSAGGGLAWSLLVYLAALERLQGVTGLGVPSSVILISPWLSLPPTSDEEAQLYPDVLNQPQLQGAVRNYLARYPPYPAHPDPFHAEPSPAATTIRRMLLPRRWSLSSTETSPKPTAPAAPTLAYLLSPASFTALSSTHPLYSPASAPATALSPFLSLIADAQTNFFIHTGTAEMFHPATDFFHKSLLSSGIDAQLTREEGGVHCEPLFWPASFGGAPGRCLDAIASWLDTQ